MKREGNPPGHGRVALYARVSTDRQAREGTIDSQVSAICARMEADGDALEADLCFCDDGVSGTTLVRAALERLRDQAAAGAIDRLYVLAPDRLARRHAHQMVLLEELQGCGVDVVFVNRPLGASPEDQLLVQVQGVVAEYERAKILERTRRGRLHAARCGRVNVLVRAAYGYRYIDKHAGGGLASYEVLEDEVRIVRHMFDWVGREGCSLAEVVRRLERLGVPTKSGLKRWDRSTIWGLLTNPAYQGQAAYGKTRRGERQPRLRPVRGKPEVSKHTYSTYRQPATEHIVIAVPALVDAELFAAVQERLEENRRRLRRSSAGPAICCKVSRSVAAAVMPSSASAKGRANQPTIAVMAPMAIALVDNPSAAIARSGSRTWTRRCGMSVRLIERTGSSLSGIRASPPTSRRRSGNRRGGKSAESSGQSPTKHEPAARRLHRRLRGPKRVPASHGAPARTPEQTASGLEPRATTGEARRRFSSRVQPRPSLRRPSESRADDGRLADTTRDTAGSSQTSGSGKRHHRHRLQGAFPPFC